MASSPVLTHIPSSPPCRSSFDHFSESSDVLAVFGAGGHAKVVISVAQLLGISILGVFDDDKKKLGQTILSVPIVGPIDLDVIRSFKVSRAIIAIGDNGARKSLVHRLAPLGLQWATLVHPSATVHSSVKLGHGTLVCSNACIQPGGTIGEHCIINTSVSVDHDANVANFVHISPAATLCGCVTVGECTWIGAGATIIHYKTIGYNTMIGAGTVVIRDMGSNLTAVGNPARIVPNRTGTLRAPPTPTSDQSRAIAPANSQPSLTSQSVGGAGQAPPTNSIRWCPYKALDFVQFQAYLQPSLTKRHVTNTGPCQALLCTRFHQMIGSPTTHTVLSAANGTAALHALLIGLRFAKGRELRAVTQAFTFPPSVQGPFVGSLIVDLDPKHYGPDLASLEKHKNEFDVVVITNCFGFLANLDLYNQWCADNSKLLIMDNAATPLTTLHGTNSLLLSNAGAIISLHETKPLGRGEGGFVIVPNEYASAVHRAMNFGFAGAGNQDYHVWASNWRMSDIAAAAVLCYLDTLDEAISKHAELFDFADKMIQKHSDKISWLFPTFPGQKTSFVSCLPILTKKETNPIISQLVSQFAIEAKQYYKPLAGREEVPNAWALYSHEVSLPLHRDLTITDVEFMINSLLSLL